MPPINFRPVQMRHFTPEGISEFQQMWQELVTQVNISQGVHGPIPVYNHINMNGNLVQNSGQAQESTDLLTQEAADPMYSTATQQAAFEATGSKILQTARKLNDGTKQHKISSDLNLQGSVPPSNITGTLAYTSTTTTIIWTWTSIIVQLADLSYVGIKNGTLTVTGLVNATGYAFYAYYDTSLGILSFVADSVNASGAPPIAFAAGGNTAASQAQTQDGRISLTNGKYVATTGSSGTATLRTRS